MASLDRVLLVGVLAVASCIEPPAEVVCGTLICPMGDVCLPDGTCTTAEDGAACANMADGSSCTTSGFEGVCQRGACRAPTCGDGFVDGNEQCDGPVAGDCVDYGFDLGAPACSSCVIDVTDTCVRFGWVQISTAIASAAWTDGTRMGVITRAQDAFEIYDLASGQLVAREPGTFYQVTGDAQRIIAWGGSPEVMVQWDGTSFTTVDLGALSGSLEWAALDKSDVMWIVSIATGCTVSTLTRSGSLAIVRPQTPSTACSTLYIGDGDVLLATTDTANNVDKWDGTQFSFVFSVPAQIDSFAARDGAIYAVTGTATYRYDGTVRSYAGAGTPVPLDTGLYVGGAGGDMVDRFEGNNFEALDAPIVGQLITDGSKMYMVGNGVYVYTGLQYANRLPQSAYLTTVALFGDGTVAMTDSLADIVTEEPGNSAYWNQVQVAMHAELSALTGNSYNDFYATDGVKLYRGTGPMTVTSVPWNIGSSTVRGVWEAPSGVLYAVGDGGFAMTRATNGTWTAIAPPAGQAGCDVLGITGTGTMVLAAASCGTAGAVWELSGASWTQIYSGARPLAAIAIDAAGDIFTAGPSGGARAVAGTWTDDPGAIGVSISATTPSDVWIAGDPGEVIHWDGMSWSRLGVVGAANPRVAVSPRAVYISGVSNPVLVR